MITVIIVVLIQRIKEINGGEATALNADAIVGVRYGSSAVMQGAAEIVAYGTSVKFR